MRFFFFHQSFPGQYRLLAQALAEDPRHEVFFITQGVTADVPGVEVVLYEKPDISALRLHTLTAELDFNILTGVAVADACRALQGRGVRPDIMIGHGGWGETLFLKDVFPDVPLLTYFEFYYHRHGVDADFDPEFAAVFEDPHRLRIKNAVIQMAYDATDWGNSPTQWQRSLHPPEMRSRISVIHEGIDTTLVAPNPKAQLLLPGSSAVLDQRTPVITFVARNLEPYRGFHRFMRSLPLIQKRNPEAITLVVGGDGVSYGTPPPPGSCFREVLLQELEGQLDLSRIHFLGKVDYATYLKVLQISSAHVYLTYPFVLSWSFIEAMAAGCLMIGSETAPVLELLEDRRNGLTVDFFSAEQLAEAVTLALTDKKLGRSLRARSLAQARAEFSFHSSTFPRWQALIDKLIG